MPVTPETYEDYYRLVKSVLRRKGIPEDDIEDVAMDAWEQAVRYAPVDDQSKRGLLVKITFQAAGRYWERVQRERETFRNIDDVKPHAPGPEPIDWNDVYEKLSYLTGAQRKVVVAEAYGYTPQEVADWLGISRRTVHQHTYNAKQALRG